MNALVIYESMFGDNEQVARAVAEGLSSAGVVADAVEVGHAPTDIRDVDLLVVGAPNHAWSLPRAATRADAATKTDAPVISDRIGVREWLAAASLPAGVMTAAYDTRGSRPKSVVAFDHASSSIEKGLKGLGGRRLAKAENFRVVDMKGPLEPGEIERAREWGGALARQLTAG